MAANIRDVAARCGLSISTVSKAFNDYADISEETRALVRAAAREIGYYPNAIARTLKTNRSFNLGVLFEAEGPNGLVHWYFSSVLDAFKREGERRGYDLTFVNHHVGWSGMTYLEHCRYRNVDGLCVVCADCTNPEVAALALGDIPSVIIDHIFENRACVRSDNFSGMRQLVDYAASLGHRRVAYVHGQPDSAVTQQRLAGFLDGVSANRLDPLVRASAYDDPDAARAAVTELLQSPNPPTCILLPDDHCCLGALEAASALGLRVPEDVSLGGFDGNPMIQSQPRLTTVAQDPRRIGARAAELLIARVESVQPLAGEVVDVPVRLVPGESMGRKR